MLKAALELHRPFLWFDMFKIEQLSSFVHYKLTNALFEYYTARLLKYYKKGFKTVVGYKTDVTFTEGVPSAIRLSKII
jgi:hypothetical protein